MRIDELNPKHFLADEGKVFRRISDGLLYGEEIYLGYTFMVDGVTLRRPLLELPEHFEEVDKPVQEDDVVLDETTDLVEPLTESKEFVEVAPVTDEPPKKVTISDYRALEKQVALLTEAIKGNSTP